MTQTSAKKSLYDRDLNLWVEETVAKLKARQFDELDLDYLIDEVEAFTKSDKRELPSRLKVLLSHLLKRHYVKSIEDFRGWELTNFPLMLKVYSMKNLGSRNKDDRSISTTIFALLRLAL